MARPALLVRDSEIVNDALARQIREFIDDPARLRKMADNCARLSTRNAASAVVETMERYTAG